MVRTETAFEADIELFDFMSINEFKVRCWAEKKTNWRNEEKHWSSCGLWQNSTAYARL